MKKMTKTWLVLCAATAPAAWAAGYPERPVRLVVPYAVGGATDVIGRVVARYLGEELGQPVVVENKPGAGGSTGSLYAAKQPADGYTLVMMVESSHAVNPNVYAKPAYDPLKDFTPISNIANVPGVMVVGVDSLEQLELYLALSARIGDFSAILSEGLQRFGEIEPRLLSPNLWEALRQEKRDGRDG